MGAVRDRTARRLGRGGRWCLALLLAAALLVGLLPIPATLAAASCVVTSTGNSGAGTLRQCLVDVDAGGTITFSLANPSTITLTSGPLAIAKSLTITGPGASALTVSGNDAGRVFVISVGTVAIGGLTIAHGKVTNDFGAGMQISGGTVTLTACVITANTQLGGTAMMDYGGGGVIVGNGAALTLSGSTVSGNTAYTGAGLYSQGGTLTLTNSVISDNIASRPFGGYAGGGIEQHGGTVTLTSSIVSGNIGGGLRLWDGAATLTNSTISGNNGSGNLGGGGIFAWSMSLTLTNSTVSGNSGPGSPGIQAGGSTTLVVTGSTISGNAGIGGGHGGGIYQQGGTLALTNSTISGNSVGYNGGGLDLNGTVAMLRFVTITGNTADSDNDNNGVGGGIRLGYGTINAQSSIVVGNRRGAATTEDCVGAITSQGYNLWGDHTACPTGGTGDRDLATLGQTVAQVFNPTLADNDGATKTHALVPGSPALDLVPTGACQTAATPIVTDQRGITRPQGTACDMGAYERVVAASANLVLTLTVVGGGQVQLTPPVTTSGGGTFPYAPGTVVTLTPQPAAGQTFIGWTVGGVVAGWANTLTLTMNADQSVQATFAPTKNFPDVGSGRADFTAITELASRTTIRGYGDGSYGPDDGVQRAQMAALIARATSAGPGIPTGGTLAPPACLAAGTWDCEDWGNGFSDRNGLDANLWRNVGALQHYQVAFGYDGASCAAKGVASPCYAPTAPVSYVETIVFITRAMIAKGYWVAQPNAPQPYAGVPAVFGPTVATYQFYTAGAGGVPAPPGNWNAGATRGWFARALWVALNTYWATDSTLPDGRPAGGNVT